jgi:hypothetical protein
MVNYGVYYFILQQISNVSRDSVPFCLPHDIHRRSSHCFNRNGNNPYF